MRYKLAALFLLIGFGCFLTISWLMYLGLLPLGWWLALCFGGMVLVGFVGWLKIKPVIDEATTEIEDV